MIADSIAVFNLKFVMSEDFQLDCECRRPLHAVRGMILATRGCHTRGCQPRLCTTIKRNFENPDFLGILLPKSSTVVTHIIGYAHRA